MSEFDPKSGGINRRSVTIGGGIAVALELAALGVTAPRLFAKRYAKTPYDDLLALLVDREAAQRVGKTVNAEVHKRYPIDGILETRDNAVLARELRDHFHGRNLHEQMTVEIGAGRLYEVGGWVLPASLAGLCLLAADV